MKNEGAGVASMDHEPTVAVAQVFAGLLFLSMVFYMMRRARSNRRSMLEKNAPRLLRKMKWVVVHETRSSLRNPMTMRWK